MSREGPLPWRSDRCLRELRLEDVRILSLDVFDTLVLRTVHRPEDVFLDLGDMLRAAGLLRHPMPPRGFLNARIFAEATARQRKRLHAAGGEVTLAEIYEELHEVVRDLEAAARLEVLAEQRSVRINPLVSALLEEAKSFGIRVVLLSDMYLGGAHLEQLVTHAGLSPGLFDDVLVSSEWGCSKADGGLYNVLLDRVGRENAGDIVHVGDNYMSDVAMARSRGIRAMHYHSLAEDPGATLVLEEALFGPFASEQASARRLAQAIAPDGVSAAWFRFGAAVLGPFVAAFADWIVECCQAESISRVCPVMREGFVLGEAISRAAQARGIELEVLPLWASRQATLFPSLADLPDDAVDRLLKIDILPLRVVLAGLGLEVPTDLATLADVPPAHVPSTDPRLSDSLRACLTSPETRARVMEHLVAARATLRRYLHDTLGPGRAAIVELGYHGTTMRAFHDVLREGDRPDPVYLLALGTEALWHHALAGMDIRLFAQSVDRTSPLLVRALRTPAALEECLFGPHGTTLGYESDVHGNVHPILANPPPEDAVAEGKRACQDGIRTYQRLHLRASVPPMDPEDVCRVLVRHVEVPTCAEARALGTLRVNLGLGSEHEVSLLDPKGMRMMLELGVETFLDRTTPAYFPHRVFWPQAIVAAQDPLALPIRAFRSSPGTGTMVAAYLEIVGTLQASGRERVVVWGAGLAGRAAALALRLAGTAPLAFVDKNRRLWGGSLAGAMVVGPGELAALDADAVVVGSFIHGASIAADIRAALPPLSKAVVLAPGGIEHV